MESNVHVWSLLLNLLYKNQRSLYSDKEQPLFQRTLFQDYQELKSDYQKFYMVLHYLFRNHSE